MNPTVTAEIPFYFPAGGEDLFGIVTPPVGRPRGVGVIILPGGAFVGATNRNRVSVTMARRLAARGYHGVRVDYRGVGESTGSIDAYRLDRPFVEDVLGAVHALESIGVHEFVLVGTTCFGSRTAIAAAEQVAGLRAVIGFATPVRDFPLTRDPAATPTSHYVRSAFSPRAVRGLFDPKKRAAYSAVARTKWRTAVRRAPRRPASGSAGANDGAVSDGFLKPLAGLAKEGVPVLLGYGLDDDLYEEFRAASEGPRLAKVFDGDSRIEVRTVPGVAHALLSLDVQDAVIDLTESWLTELEQSTRLLSS